jgi:hypothetical protein
MSLWFAITGIMLLLLVTNLVLGWLDGSVSWGLPLWAVLCLAFWITDGLWRSLDAAATEPTTSAPCSTGPLGALQKPLGTRNW